MDCKAQVEVLPMRLMIDSTRVADQHFAGPQEETKPWPSTRLTINDVMCGGVR